MEKITYFICSDCGKKHMTAEKALMCEKNHKKPVSYERITDDTEDGYPRLVRVTFNNGAVKDYQLFGE